ncbi:MAG: M20 family metallopeptidase [Chloroflexi bacterium]|nr:M20 family metallopeptidase [Chloroflexota bacterium]
MRQSNLKKLVCDYIDSNRAAVLEISHQIHSNPETGFHEERASVLLADYLCSQGMAVERGIYGMPTAFSGSYGEGKPAIALLAEYDALPDLGHACGHNIIAAIAVAAGTSLKAAVDRLGGRVVVLGTPAEELYGGKAIMVERGAFTGIDSALIVHPGRRDATGEPTLACIGLDIQFFGKEAHAAAYPELGVNALEAMVLSFNAINSLRQHIRRTARIHGIITDGGKAANVVPGQSAGTFLVRAADMDYLAELKSRVISCFQGAAQATGARLEYKWAEHEFACLRSNRVLAKLFTGNMSALGRHVGAPSDSSLGSTDMGNVSQVVPAIHPTISITTPEVTIHSPQFALAAASQSGDKGVIDGAKAMAMTVVDLLLHPEYVVEAWKDFSG